MQWLKWKRGNQGFPNLSIFLKYGEDLLERISNTGSKTGFQFRTFEYESSTKYEELRVKYKFNYEADELVYLTVRVAYNKKDRELTLTIIPDLITREADKYAGQYSELYHHDMFGTFFRGIENILNEQLEKYRTKFLEYLTQLKNMDTEFIIDSIEYIAKLTDKYPDYEITTNKETGDIGYTVRIESKESKKNYVEFDTSPFRLADYDGFFRDFIQDAFLDYVGFVGSTKDFWSAVETLVDGALEHKKLLKSTYDKYSKIVKAKEEED